MSAVTLIGLAGSISLLSGWRLYLCLFATGLAMRFGWIAPPSQLHALDVLANGWVIGVAGVAAVAEFFADKVPWIDTAWDAVHTLIRPVGGAMLSLAIIDPKEPAWQVVVLLLGGGAALLTHGAKAGTRAIVNASPEPVSNIVLSSGEDLTTLGLAALVLTHPAVAIFVAVPLLVSAVLMLVLIRSLVRRLMSSGRRPEAASGIIASGRGPLE